MKKINYGIILALTLVLSLFTSCREQSTSSKVLLNEIMMVNETNSTDEYGEHCGWVELFVKYYGPIDLAAYSIKVTVDGQTTTYVVPKGDVITQIQPRQHILFWADGYPNRGTLHTSFTFDPSKTTKLELYNSNKDKIDEVTIPAGTLGPNQAYGRVTDTSTQWEVKDNTTTHAYITPGSSNRVNDTNAKMQKFSEHDSVGIGMTLTAMVVVFSCLILLFFSFKTVGKVSMKMSKRNAMKAQGITDEKEAEDKNLDQIPAEVYAVIGLALHEMQNDVHDIENMVLTMTEEKHTESPWSSKSLLMRRMPIRKR